MTGSLHRRASAASWAALSCCVIATPAFAQTLARGGGVEIPAWRVAGALALCLALAVAGAFALRARMRGGGAATAPLPKGVGVWSALAATAFRAVQPAAAKSANPRLKMVESLRLGPQLDVCLVECDGRDFILAATPQGAFVVRPEDQTVSRASQA